MRGLNFNRNPFFLEENLDDRICSELGMPDTARKLRQKPSFRILKDKNLKRSSYENKENILTSERDYTETPPGRALSTDLTTSERDRIIKAQEHLILEEGLNGRLDTRNSDSVEDLKQDSSLPTSSSAKQLVPVLGRRRAQTIYEEVQNVKCDYR